MLKKVVVNLLRMAVGILRMPFVDFKWDISKYDEAMQEFDKFRANGYFTDEELGGVIEVLAERQPKILSISLNALAGLFRSKLIDFSWRVASFKKLFDQLTKMRKDKFFEDEELADFFSILADTLEK